MKILITGGYGFIGSHCADALSAAGHEVIRGGRGEVGRGKSNSGHHMSMDFMRDLDVQLWRRRLPGINAVINAVGAMGPARNLETLHFAAPRALFEACRAMNIEVINISALGADADARSTFHLTKKAADDYLLATHPRAVVLQPSLIYGPGGASARMFDTLASLPVIPLVGDGSQRIQPVHIDDMAALVTRIVGSGCCYGRRIPVVGPAPLKFRDYVAELRSAMGLAPAAFVHLPHALVAPLVGLLARLHIPWASPEALAMLERGNIAPAADMTQLLGRPPKPPREFITPNLAACVARTAKWVWLSILMRLAIAAVWLTAGIVSAGIYPLERSVALVEATGVWSTAATTLVYFGAAIDVVLGLATLFMRQRSLLWLAQIAVIVAYTIIISIWLPEFWLHPFGPVVKNLPLLIAIYLMYEFERP